MAHSSRALAKVTASWGTERVLSRVPAQSLRPAGCPDHKHSSRSPSSTPGGHPLPLGLALPLPSDATFGLRAEASPTIFQNLIAARCVCDGHGPRAPGLPRISPCEYLRRASPVGTGRHPGPGVCPRLSCDIRQIKAPLSTVVFALFLRLEPVSRDCPSLLSDSGWGADPRTRLPVQPRRSSWQGPHRKRIVSPGSEARHTLTKNEKVGRPGSSLCLQPQAPTRLCMQQLGPGEESRRGWNRSQSWWRGKGSRKEPCDGPAQHPSENTQEKGHPEKHEHGLSRRCQILPSPPLVSNEGANQMIQPHEWQRLSSQELITS